MCVYKTYVYSIYTLSHLSDTASGYKLSENSKKQKYKRYISRHFETLGKILIFIFADL